jgi:hypothetical protein
MPVSDPAQLSALPRMRPAPRLLVGGAGWNGVNLPAGVDAVRVDSLDETLRRIETAVSS